ncbi:hypothetical protein EVAR_37873_1 [Eumeta japonica]|uniref:Uncharacterized protein n=1 Tax=Eumeta variegata TaxID=151549 RepID=A0A4C1X2J4_EUMVA|nr:hypothetical protein EVAR_37873_1 [Eumeta japonica]
MTYVYTPDNVFVTGTDLVSATRLHNNGPSLDKGFCIGPSLSFVSLERGVLQSTLLQGVTRGPLEGVESAFSKRLVECVRFASYRDPLGYSTKWTRSVDETPHSHRIQTSTNGFRFCFRSMSENSGTPLSFSIARFFHPSPPYLSISPLFPSQTSFGCVRALALHTGPVCTGGRQRVTA